MSTEAIWDLLDTRLKAQVDAITPASARPAIQAANMEKDTALPILRPTILPATPVQVELGDDGRNLESGIYQVDCYYPSGAGRAGGMALAQAIAANFKRGTRIAGSGFTLRLKHAVVLRMREEPDRVNFPVEIGWYAYTPNP